MKKEPLVEKALELFSRLQPLFATEYDDSGAIGKRYRRQDELGTPFCITIDFDTLEQGTATLRERDSMQQERVPLDRLPALLATKVM
jgi:glycyl-tRNA synthetase